MKHDPTFQKQHAQISPNAKPRTWFVVLMRAWIERLQTRFELSKLDAHLLADIGLDEDDPLYPDRIRRNNRKRVWWEI